MAVQRAASRVPEVACVRFWAAVSASVASTPSPGFRRIFALLQRLEEPILELFALVDDRAVGSDLWRRRLLRNLRRQLLMPVSQDRQLVLLQVGQVLQVL